MRPWRKLRSVQTTTARTRRSRSFREVFAKFSQVFRSFRKLFEDFGLALTCLDLLGCVRMRSDASGWVWMHLDAFVKIRKNRSKISVFCNFCEVFEELRKNGRHWQLPHVFLFLIDLFGARYDPWSSSWNRVLSWDDLREHHWPVPGGAQTFIRWGGVGHPPADIKW